MANTGNYASDSVTSTCTIHPAVGDAVLLQGEVTGFS